MNLWGFFDKSSSLTEEKHHGISVKINKCLINYAESTGALIKHLAILTSM